MRAFGKSGRRPPPRRSPSWNRPSSSSSLARPFTKFTPLEIAPFGKFEPWDLFAVQRFLYDCEVALGHLEEALTVAAALPGRLDVAILQQVDVWSPLDGNPMPSPYSNATYIDGWRGTLRRRLRELGGRHLRALNCEARPSDVRCFPGRGARSRCTNRVTDVTTTRFDSRGLCGQGREPSDDGDCVRSPWMDREARCGLYFGNAPQFHPQRGSSRSNRPAGVRHEEGVLGFRAGCRVD